MKRSKFLSFIGLWFTGIFFFSGKPGKEVLQTTDCNEPITPPVPEGPYYKKENLHRIDITENKKGAPVMYIFKVEDKHCNPVEAAIVDIWQCDTEGHYSDFKAENTASQTWLRGYQKTNKNGECNFKSVFPGWYDGRITHLHVKVSTSDTDTLTTNCFFPKEIENEVYKNPLYPKGPNPITIANDIELKVDQNTKRHDELVMQVTKDNNGMLTAKYTVRVS